MDLFASLGVDDTGIPKANDNSPLAVRMRPQTLDEVLGQQHLLGHGSPLRRLVQESDTESPAGVSSVILWGPPGTGKTTLAYLVARESGRHFEEVSAVSAGVKDLRNVIEGAKRRLFSNGAETVLFVDEVHRFSKSQQDTLLPAVENRWVTLVAATTENPSFSVISPLLSRSLLLILEPLPLEQIKLAITRAIDDPRGLQGRYQIQPEALESLVRLVGGDARRALTLLEAAAGVAEESHTDEITPEHVALAANVALTRWDEDQHYDVASAFIKSMRGSDPDATVHYLARMVEAGEDPRFIARRIMIAAAEDVGLAAPEILPITVAAAQAVALVGMPEARIILSEAALAVALAPKSNAAYQAVDAAIADLRAGKSAPVPQHLRDSHYPGAKDLNAGVGYLYSHEYPHAIAPQSYLPESMQDRRYYQPTEHGNEALITKRLQKINELRNLR